jgi:hypothetical protein
LSERFKNDSAVGTGKEMLLGSKTGATRNDRLREIVSKCETGKFVNVSNHAYTRIRMNVYGNIPIIQHKTRNFKR